MMTEDRLLTHDEQKAAEAAFRGLPPNSRWSQRAQQIYMGILEITHGRDVVTDLEWEDAALTV